MKTLRVASLCGLIAVLCYIGIAAILALWPVALEPHGQSLDFSVMSNPVQPDPGEQVSFEARDGSQLTYRLFDSDHNVVVVLLHGSGSEGRYLQGLAQALRRMTKATVVVPDLRGHGLNRFSKAGDIDYIGQLEHDLADLQLVLRKHWPAATVILGGHSSGGGLAVRYGGGELAPFDAYLLFAPYLGHTAPTVRPNSGGWVQVAMRRYAGLAMLNRIGISALNGLPVLFFNRPAMAQDALQLASYSYRLNESISPVDLQRELLANDKPLVVLVGSEDEAFYPGEFAPLLSAHSSRRKVIIVGGATHLALPDNPAAQNYAAVWILDTLRAAER